VRPIYVGKYRTGSSWEEVEIIEEELQDIWEGTPEDKLQDAIDYAVETLSSGTPPAVSLNGAYGATQTI
jgi:hypothetical protein